MRNTVAMNQCRELCRKLAMSDSSTKPGKLSTSQNGGEESRTSALAKAQRMAQVEHKAPGWAAQNLQGCRKSDPQKVRIACIRAPPSNRGCPKTNCQSVKPRPHRAKTSSPCLLQRDDVFLGDDFQGSIGQKDGHRFSSVGTGNVRQARDWDRPTVFQTKGERAERLSFGPTSHVINHRFHGVRIHNHRLFFENYSRAFSTRSSVSEVIHHHALFRHFEIDLTRICS